MRNGQREGVHGHDAELSLFTALVPITGSTWPGVVPGPAWALSCSREPWLRLGRHSLGSWKPPLLAASKGGREGGRE